MAIRIIRTDDDEILRKKAKHVDSIDPKIIELLKDMAETMYQNNGAGLAANQIGILRRLVVIDVGDGLVELINPVIISTSGEQYGTEGCLSLPGRSGDIKRPMKVKVEAQNRDGQKITVEGEEMLARALCHEIDHLDGILFTDKATKVYRKSE